MQDTIYADPAMNSPMTKNNTSGQTLASFKSRESAVFAQSKNTQDIPFLSRLQLSNSTNSNDLSLISSSLNNVAYAPTMPTMPTMQAQSVPMLPHYTSSPLMQLPMLLNDESTLQNQNSIVQSESSLKSLDISDASSDGLVVPRKKFDSTSSLADALFPLSRKQILSLDSTSQDVVSCISDLHTAAINNKKLMEHVCDTVGNLHDAGIKNKHTIESSLQKITNDVQHENKQFHGALDNHTQVLK